MAYAVPEQFFAVEDEPVDEASESVAHLEHADERHGERRFGAGGQAELVGVAGEAEADGAHRLPIKAHADHEPVIPDGTDKTILVIGADCFGKPISDIAHRPELFADIAGVDKSSVITVFTRRRVQICTFTVYLLK